MSAELIVCLIIACLWLIHSSHQKELKAKERAVKLQAVVATVNAIASCSSEQDETARKAAILERIKKVGIYACDGSNLHLR
jgi:tellurite resistance protein